MRDLELQQIRGPYPVAAGITAYVKHAHAGRGFGRLGLDSMSSQAAHAPGGSPRPDTG